MIDINTIYYKSKEITYIFLIGKDSSNPLTDDRGTTVCCAGLFIALASLASICE